MLVRCGAVSYGVDQLIQRYQSARAVLATLDVREPSELANLVEAQVAPVRTLLASNGAPVDLPDSLYPLQTHPA